MNESPRVTPAGQPITFGRRQIFGLAGGVAAAATLAACGSSGSSSSSGKSKQIGFAWTDTTIEVYLPLIKGARQAAAQRGYQVLQSNNGGDPTKQLADINTWIGQGVAGLTILPLDPNAIGPVAKKAEQAGIAVIGYSDNIPGQDGADVFNHPQGGTLLGQSVSKWINSTLGGKAQLAYLTQQTTAVGQQRIGFCDRAIRAGSPGAKVVGRVDNAVTAAQALTATQSLLQAHPDINVVICVADDGCPGAASAMKTGGKNPAKIYIGGFDGSKTAMDLVLAGGYVKGVAALPLLKIGQYAVDLPVNVIEHKKPTTYLADYEMADIYHLAQTKQLVADYS
jgi:ribose transport system substrate-binding protein